MFEYAGQTRRWRWPITQPHRALAEVGRPTEDAARALTKEVELGAPDEPRGRATRAGSVAHAAHDRGRDRAVLLHDEPGGRGDLVGEGHHGVMQRAAREIRAPA